jgi:predicted transcriptional regulator
LLAAEELVVSGEKAQRIAEALTATNIRILKAIYKEPLCITTLAKMLGYTEPYISERIIALEDLGLVNIKYEPGERGTRKLVSSNLERITISLKD